MDWVPPSHGEASEFLVKISKDLQNLPWLTSVQSYFTNADGAADIYQHLRLSGEDFIPEIKKEFGDKPDPPKPLLDFYDRNNKLERYRARYGEYWNSTAAHTGTGKYTHLLTAC